MKAVLYKKGGRDNAIFTDVLTLYAVRRTC